MAPRAHSFERAVLATARQHHLLEPGDHVLVALSGGPDSTALLSAMAALRTRGAVDSVSACHVDHRLRPESVADGDFCAELCGSLAVPLYRVAIDQPRAGNLQSWARRVRYRALRDVADRCGATVIATGHTRSDQAETLLLRLLRGAGARGLSAIPIRRGRIVRPLLERSRAEVLAYLRERALTAREDPTNRSPRYLRNRVRHEVLPALEALVPGIERRLARTASLLREDDHHLERLTRAIVPRDTAVVSVDVLRAAPLAIRRRAVRQLWLAATGSRRALGAEHVDDVLRLLRRRSPGSVDLPGGFVAEVAYGAIRVRSETSGGRASRPFAPIVVVRDGSYVLPDGAVVELRWASESAPPWPVEVRRRRPGDRFRPAGGRGGKKLKAWLIDRKVPRTRRDELLVIAASNGEVLCVPELGAVSERAKALSVFVRPGR